MSPSQRRSTMPWLPDAPLPAASFQITEVGGSPTQIVRDGRGVIVGRFELQRLTGKIVARDARGIIVGAYDQRSDLTRDFRGRVVGRGYLLPALLFPAR